MTEVVAEPQEKGESLRLRQSESITELAKALSKAQSQVEDALKDSDNPYFSSRYADLASVWHACRAALTDNGLAVVQSPAYAKQSAIVTTRLLHSSGEWLEGTLAMPCSKADAHGVGSAITYARRYSLAAIVGVAPDDDDGNAAVGNKTAPAAKRTPELHNGDDHENWVKWTQPPQDALESDEPHPWYLSAVKGLLYHIGATNVGNARKVFAWLSPDDVIDVASAKTRPEFAKLAWERLMDRSNAVPFTRMLNEASKETQTSGV